MSQSASASRSPHPLLQAGRSLLSDLLSTLVFAALYAATHSTAFSVSVAIAVGLARIVRQKLRGDTIDAMQWLSLLLVVVLGGASALTHNPKFVMLKPTLIYCAIGAVMLRPGWMNRYAPPIAQQYGADLLAAFGYVWAALMFATAGANLAVAVLAGPAAWVWFVGTVPLASKAALVLAQYGTMRGIIRRRIRAARPAAVAL